MIKGHGGDIYTLARNLDCEPGDIIDMSSNMNPLGPVPALIEHLRGNLMVLDALPGVDGKGLVGALADVYGLSTEKVLVGNGTTQFIFSAPLALGMKKALILGPTYADYADACRTHKVDLKYVEAEETNQFKPDLKVLSKCLEGFDTAFICNPNNPTGNLIGRLELIDLCKSHPMVRFIIDESYLPFTDQYDETTMLNNDLNNVIVLHSFSKIFCIPGLRLGFMVASPNKAACFRRYYQPWSVNSLAQSAGLFLLNLFSSDDAFIKTTQTFIEKEHQLFRTSLAEVNALKLFPSVTSFILIKIKEKHDASQLCSILSKDRILIRNCGNFEGLSDQYVRISLKDAETNAMVAERLREIFD
jgi:threonine-phosphate decarboxylase